MFVGKYTLWPIVAGTVAFHLYTIILDLIRAICKRLIIESSSLTSQFSPRKNVCAHVSYSWTVENARIQYTRKRSQVVTNLQQTCSNTVPTTCQQDVFALLVPSLLTNCQWFLTT